MLSTRRIRLQRKEGRRCQGALVLAVSELVALTSFLFAFENNLYVTFPCMVQLIDVLRSTAGM